MDRANVTSGAAFKTALRGTAVLVAVLILSGVIAFFYLRREMIAELEDQIVEDQIVLAQIYQHGGVSELIDAINTLRHPLPTKLRALGLFDAHGAVLAGNIDLAPDVVGWSEVQLSILHLEPSETPLASGTFHVNSTTLDGFKLVVGRNLEAAEAKEDRLLFALSMMGIVVGAAFLILGYGASLSSLRKLDRMADVLDRVSQGDAAARLGVSKDNDQIDRVARAMNVHLERLSILMGTTKANAAAIAHDLRTPLSRAFLAVDKAQLVLERGEDPRTSLDEIEAELTRLRSIFDVILRISRLEQATDDTSTAPVALAPILADLAETFGALAEDKGQTLILNPVVPGLAIRADAAMLSQLVANLLQNAITHCPPETVISLGAAAENGIVRLWVADTGPGIPEAERDKVFELFYSVDPNRTQGGNGLGLALVKAIAERLGGQITLSDASPGLRVEVAFPASAEISEI
ncbi:MAG: ATP-binding protein [Paracoccaceae bacterium]